MGAGQGESLGWIRRRVCLGIRVSESGGGDFADFRFAFDSDCSASFDLGANECFC